jgi:hypothetical protein
VLGRIEAHVCIRQIGLRGHPPLPDDGQRPGSSISRSPLLHGKDECVFGDSGYTATDKRVKPSCYQAMFFIATKRSQVGAIGKARERKQVERLESW